MRISSNMMYYNFLGSLNKQMENQADLQEKIADQKRLHRASDDPVAVMRSLRYSSQYAQNEQYTNGVNSGQSIMQTADDAVSSLDSIMLRVKELVVRAVSPSTSVAYQAAATEIDGLINEAVNVANTKLGDQYIFAGQMDATQPFTRQKIADPEGKSNLTVDRVVYSGDQNALTMITHAGDVSAARDSVSLTGLDLFGDTSTNYGTQTATLLNNLIRLKEELEKKGAITQTNTSGGGLNIGGTWKGPADANDPSQFQDFAVKIDALRLQIGKVLVNGANASATSKGTLQLSYGGTTDKTPAATKITVNTTQVQALNSAAYTLPTHATGEAAAGIASLERNVDSASATFDSSSKFYIKVDAVKVNTGTVVKTNPLGGNLTVAYNGYSVSAGATAVVPANVYVKIMHTTSANGTVGEVDSIAYATSSAALTDSNSPPWSTTISAGSTNWSAAITLGSAGLKINMGSDADNTVSSTYTVPLTATNQVMQASYSTTDTAVASWTTVAFSATETSGVPLHFVTSAGLTFSIPDQVADIVEPNGTGVAKDQYAAIYNKLGDVHKFNGLNDTGRVMSASYEVTTAGTNGSTVVNGQATMDFSGEPPRIVCGTTGVTAVIGTVSANMVNDKYETEKLTLTGQPVDTSYSLDNGNKWIKTEPLAITKSNSVGGDAFVSTTDATNIKIQDVITKITAMKVSDSMPTYMKIAYNGATSLLSPPKVIVTKNAAGTVTDISFDGKSITTTTPDPLLLNGTKLAGANTGVTYLDTYTNPEGTKITVNGTEVDVSGMNLEQTATALTAKTSSSGISFSTTPNPANHTYTINMTNTVAATISTKMEGTNQTNEFVYGNYAVTLDMNSTAFAAIPSVASTTIYEKSAAPVLTQPVSVAYSTDKGSTWQETGTALAVTKSNAKSGDLTLANNVAASTLPATADFQVAVQTMGSNGKVSSISYTYNGTTTSDITRNQDGTFTLGTTGLRIRIDDNTSTATGDNFKFTYTQNADDASTTSWALPSGATINIGNNAANANSNTYSFRIPPEVALGTTGISAGISTNVGNAVKDVYTFNMKKGESGPDHAAEQSTGPDMTWLSDVGLGYVEAIHNNILKAQTKLGTQSSMYNMVSTMLESANYNINDAASKNESLDVAKATIDLKQAENTYQMALSVGGKIMPMSLIDFLK